MHPKATASALQFGLNYHWVMIEGVPILYRVNQNYIPPNLPLRADQNMVDRIASDVPTEAVVSGPHPKPACSNRHCIDFRAHGYEVAGLATAILSQERSTIDPSSHQQLQPAVARVTESDTIDADEMSKVGGPLCKC